MRALRIISHLPSAASQFRTTLQQAWGPAPISIYGMRGFAVPLNQEHWAHYERFAHAPPPNEYGYIFETPSLDPAPL